MNDAVYGQNSIWLEKDTNHKLPTKTADTYWLMVEIVTERFVVDRVNHRTHYGSRIPRDSVQQRF